MGLENILIKDYKTFYVLDNGDVGFGISSIVVPINILLETFSLEGLCD